MSTSTATDIIGSVVTGIGDVLTTALPGIFLLLAVLLGIGLGIWYVRHYIARKK